MNEIKWGRECARCKHIFTCQTGIQKECQLCIRFEERRKEDGREKGTVKKD